MKFVTCITLWFLLGITFGHGQINYTANDLGSVPVYNGYFYYGVNGGWYGSSWDDRTLADITLGNPSKNIKGVGAYTNRPPLSENFLEAWGYNIRVPEFTYNAALGARDITIILDIPSAAHKDNNRYNGCTDESKLFKNMYEPIWDGGANGTPVNDNNYYALYVYKTATTYKSFAKFWEIVNEPDFDLSGNGWKSRGEPGNWWDNNPQPCELANMKAPIFHYIRLLRISYEVIKYVDPTAYVATGGIGYAGFLDAILRNTDNPVDGSITGAYPHKGGAYFDVLSYHSYPMYNLRYWSNAAGGFVYTRHSDEAVNILISGKKNFDSLLATHGYNNITHPKKIFICTENNIPHKQLDTYIGGDEVHRNYVVKSQLESQKNDVRQLYMFVLGDTKHSWEATDPYEMMGLFKKLEGAGPLTNGGVYNHQYNEAGIAYKTCSDILLYHRYDAAKTNAMNLPANIGGGAFKDSIGNYVYALWAKTSVDMSENANATYTFPAAVNIAPLLKKKEWNYFLTNAFAVIPATNITLTGSPIFLAEHFQLVPLRDDSIRRRNTASEFALSVYPNPATTSAFLKFTLTKPAKVTVDIYGADGKLLFNAIAAKQFTTGTHSISLASTKHLPSGVYYCRFQTDGIKIMKQLIVAK